MKMTRVDVLKQKYTRTSTRGILDKGIVAELSVLTDISLSLAIIAEALTAKPQPCDDDGK